MSLDHSDILSCKSTGFGILYSSSVQEAHDFALAAHIATLEGRVPFLHGYDGFRTSHELAKIEQLNVDEIASLLPHDKIQEFRERGFNTEHPTIRGTPVTGDVSMQIYEAANKWFEDMPQVFEEVCEKVSKVTGRKLDFFGYEGHPEAEEVIVIMGSAAKTVEESVEYLNKNNDTKLGVLNIHLYRPFSPSHLLKSIPKSCKKITVLDRVRDYGSHAEPLYLDVSTAIKEAKLDHIDVINGIYGLVGMDLTPGMIKSIVGNMKKDEPKRHFTVGVEDDLTHNSLSFTDSDFNPAPESNKECLYYGMHGDGMWMTNASCLGMVAQNSDLYTQGYYSFESSKKSHGWGLSQVRFGNDEIKSEYEIIHADFIACHDASFMEKVPMLERMKDEGGIFLLNSDCETEDDVNNLIPDSLKRVIFDKKIRVFNIRANKLAKEMGIASHQVLQAASFQLANIADSNTSDSLASQFLSSVNSNGDYSMVTEAIMEVPTSEKWANVIPERVSRFDDFEDRADDMIKDIVFPVMNNEKTDFTVKQLESWAAGHLPTGTSQYERRSLASKIPVWDSSKCIQCNDCSFVCPHACIRPFLTTADEAAKFGLETLKADVNGEYRYTLQVAAKDCMGCTLCATECESEALTMVPVKKLNMDSLTSKWEAVRSLPSRMNLIESEDHMTNIETSQFNQPLFEFPGACAGCGQTPYAKLLTQLYGDRMYIANAAGCSIIWSAHFPTLAYAKNEEGHGPIWGNSLFEDNAEYGYGMLRALKHRRVALADRIEEAGHKFADFKKISEGYLKNMMNSTECEKSSSQIRKWLLTADKSDPIVQYIEKNQEVLRKPSNWLIGGDGWAYDIGFNGLDHVLSRDNDINCLVFDNEAYANTGFQKSKSTPHSVVTKFASKGNNAHKKDLGMMMMQYGHVYVASVAMGADKSHLLKTIMEAESYNGPSLIIAYTPCIGHSINGAGLNTTMDVMRSAVDTGYWPLYRFDPRRTSEGKNPFQLDSKVTEPLEKFIENEGRFSALQNLNPKLVKEMRSTLQNDLNNRWRRLIELSEVTPSEFDCSKEAVVNSGNNCNEEGTTISEIGAEEVHEWFDKINCQSRSTFC
eukprot:TRINITY_DN130_c0_g1_i1.p1 TRINITY_DN130_c0_g1~~TRINITY_DN130_c0_g1_i1.p1  ORF type:complete len:1131 (+),score=422.96 TRINITY_DN130_c0_g1_i1:106-3393(+)